MNVLNSHNITTPMSSQLIIFVVGSLECLLEGVNVLVVFLLGVSQGNTGGCLLVDQLSESCLSSDETVGDSLLSAKSRQEDHHFNGVNIMSNDNQLGFSLLHKGGNVVETELEDGGFSSLLLGVLLGVFSFLL